MLTGLKQLKIRFDIRVVIAAIAGSTIEGPWIPTNQKECIGPKDDRDPDITIGYAVNNGSKALRSLRQHLHQ